MLESSRLKTTIEILAEAKKKPADKIISDYFRANRYIGSKDKKAILNIFYRILRNWYKYSWHLECQELDNSEFNLILIDTAMNGSMDLFDGSKYGLPKLNTKQKEIFKALSEKKLISKDMPLQVRLECSDDYWEIYKNSFDNEEEIKNELEKMFEEAPFDIRINPLKVSNRENIIKKLPNATTTDFSPVGIRLNSRINLAELPIFKNGEIEVQDEGSQLISLIVDAKPGDSIVDFCAGAGGKSLLMAGTMKNKGRIVACDIFEGKLKRAKQRFKRANVQNTSTKLIDNNFDSWAKRNYGKIDKVLVDAPCSGSGTWRRNPDMKIKPIDIKSITETQLYILKRASKLVKKGGYLYYATCSMFKDENENIVKEFLSENTDFQLSKIETNFLNMDNEGYLNLSPYKTNTDGFFIAKLCKKVV